MGMCRSSRFACIRNTRTFSTVQHLLHRDMKYANACAAAAEKSLVSKSASSAIENKSPVRVSDTFLIGDNPISSILSSTGNSHSHTDSSASAFRSKRKGIHPIRAVQKGSADTVPGLIIQLGFGTFGPSSILRTVDYIPFPTRQSSISAARSSRSSNSNSTGTSSVQTVPARPVRSATLMSKARQTAAMSRSQARAATVAKRAATRAINMAAAASISLPPSSPTAPPNASSAAADSNAVQASLYDPFNKIDSSCSDEQGHARSAAKRPVRSTARNRQSRAKPY
ncbi:hypothetical protein BATDEDRAFT_85015 [Batrachochytrium dendrobatidis JAM81]|uniref:Uncharacterized protein n=2 Tax=Batrachochytrium dendrobatidis TaxID=109871 RepID=F4NSZ6_BATDJ|nr:uncharacterized protein BATDEDRAFT_85015 [Batrachochytrium dendrobatidis JAM81]EGF83469.1 hypothetical protein BATDEDRAFT_85015 [Batrachochytrium dendrobatidis JAM81]OAJ37116.1 hypothetical protein BDEG_21181 [Batrachochytrium dendrobatidis JEL423]|eukprot:XP_006676107.1 hypothetical protein BATDEDRAFT_85015 [Batrachochytrium dendrobatidis JAM81]